MSPQKQGAWTIAGYVAQALLIGLVAFMLWAHTGMKRRVIAAERMVGGHFAAGDALAELVVLDTAYRQSTLSFQSSRVQVVLVNPSCDSCAAVARTLGGHPQTLVLTMAPPQAAKEFVERYRVANPTYAIARPLPRGVGARMGAAPQIFVIDHGRVVRTCASLTECGM